MSMGTKMSLVASHWCGYSSEVEIPVALHLTERSVYSGGGVGRRCSHSYPERGYSYPMNPPVTLVHPDGSQVSPWRALQLQT